MILKYLLILIFIFASIQKSYSQQAATAQYPTTINYQDTIYKVFKAENDLNVDVRMLPENRIDIFKNDPELNYDNKLPEADDWITKIKNWINQQLAALASSETYSTILDYLYYGLMIVALFLIVRGIIKADRRGLLFGKLRPDTIKLTEIEEDISKLDFDDLISSAIDSKNYKLAIRYLFLKSIQLLAEKGIIELRNNKTNYQYLSEIKNKQIAQEFQSATTKFEWTWYGNFPIDDDMMKTSHTEFINLFGLITS